MVMVTFPATPDRRLSAPSSASMNSSAFFSAASEMPGGSPARAGLFPSPIVPPADFFWFSASPPNQANTAMPSSTTRRKFETQEPECGAISAAKELDELRDHLMGRLVDQPMARAFD